MATKKKAPSKKAPAKKAPAKKKKVTTKAAPAEVQVEAAAQPCACGKTQNEQGNCDGSHAG